MLAHVHCPDILQPDELDRYLQHGWFRMGQTIFTTNFLRFNHQYYSAIWLRIDLNRYVRDSLNQKLIRLNAKFSVTILPASITHEKEALYALYKGQVSFEASSSLQHLMLREALFSIYNTYEVNVYDDDQLIACGFFDIGSSSAAGITSFYHPGYKKYSLGKYLIYLKLHYCKELGLDYFYPGYFVPGYSPFDYKLTIGKQVLEFFDLRMQQWLSIQDFTVEKNPLYRMEFKLNSLHQFLTQLNIISKVWKYEFFDANLVPNLAGAELFDFPLFLQCGSTDPDIISAIIVFDVRDEQYHFISCRSVWTSDFSGHADDIYTTHLLKLDHEWLVTQSLEKIVELLYELKISQINKTAQS